MHARVTTASESPDSGTHWSTPGAWTVAAGVHRIPLPLPTNGLTTVNVYAIEGDDGLTMIDGGWNHPAGKAALLSGLGELGFSPTDIRRFLVTHIHGDHYTLAAALGNEVGAEVHLGACERPSLSILSTGVDTDPTPTALRRAGAHDLADQWEPQDLLDADHWRSPTAWLADRQHFDLGNRTLTVLHTPGHTQGHVVIADLHTGLLFSGDHVLPTITPSIGYESAPAPFPLANFLASLQLIQALPDLQVLPAHGPITDSAHTRVDQLLTHHEQRLALSLAALPEDPQHGKTAHDVAQALPWTRRNKALSSLTVFDAGLATLETRAHLDVLMERQLVSHDPRAATYHRASISPD